MTTLGMTTLGMTTLGMTTLGMTAFLAWAVAPGAPRAWAQFAVPVAPIIRAQPATGVPVASPAWGEDDWDAGKKAPNRQFQQFGGGVMDQANFERWVCNGRSRDQLENSLESLLAVQVDFVKRACGLSEAQSRKLDLAGHGDVRRYTRSIDDLIAKYHEVGQDQRKFNEFAQKVFPLQMKMQTGVFDDSSLYRKILAQTLDGGQAARYDEQERQRRKFHYEAKIEIAVTNLESAVPLRAEQRQRLVKLLRDETQPPKKFGQYDYYVVLYRASQLGEGKLKPIFDDAQWKALQNMLMQGRGMQWQLKHNGIIE
jgi:hypothetical protein